METYLHMNEYLHHFEWVPTKVEEMGAHEQIIFNIQKFPPAYFCKYVRILHIYTYQKTTC